ncbi:F0F1 ATP synthase subunit B [Sulfurimonas sp.]|uniref:F0F1 ATP synthase subunit B n=1 Tax=Sulfurimonas sp. TaxID=2022749 RepID=UPI00260E869D|nr:F0F1 ATP synthase subunit B [Sulfurimonas sp.]
MSRILVLLLMISTYALASEVKDGGSDIVQRTVNFILFAGLVWYLVGEPIKNYFASRSQGIADELKKVQEKLDESIALKKDALAKISDAERFAQELAEASKKENKMIHDALMAQGEAELETVAKQNLSKKEFEERKMVREVVEEIVTETLSQSADSFDKEAMANVILKKVA